MRVLSGKRPVNPPCKRGQRGQIKREIYSFDHGYAAYLSIVFPSWRVLIYHPDPTEAIGIAKTRVTFIFKFPGYSSFRPAIFFPAISPCSTADGQRPLFTFSRAKKSGACATSPAMLEKARENVKKAASREIQYGVPAYYCPMIQNWTSSLSSCSNCVVIPEGAKG